MLVKLGSTGSEISLQPDEEGTSNGKEEVEGGGEGPLRSTVKGSVGGLQGTRAGRELPVEDTETALKSKRSVTDTDSSPGLQKKRSKNEWKRQKQWIGFRLFT